MAHSVTLGGDRLGSGKKQKIHLHGYERSTHDLGYVWRSSMSAGTLVPFLVIPGLPGDTFDIDLNSIVMTHPTVGPLFGSYKLQLDIFTADIRLYQGVLHNNKLDIGLNMANVKLPLIPLYANQTPTTNPIPTTFDWDNQQINPSHILSYLGIRGIGANTTAGQLKRYFNAVPYLMYFDTYKNYYANKQEGIGAIIHRTLGTVGTISTVAGTHTLVQAPALSQFVYANGNTIVVTYTGTLLLDQFGFNTVQQGFVTANQMSAFTWVATSGTVWTGTVTAPNGPTINNWDYSTNQQPATTPTVQTFDLHTLDTMRENILTNLNTSPFIINETVAAPTVYQWPIVWVSGQSPMTNAQEGLLLKTYQSDLFNNWMSTTWIDGPGGINDITAIDTTTGSFSLDTLNLSKKVYEMLNRIAVSGGTYRDWITAVYDQEPFMMSETPVYHGGLSKEVIFNEVISNSTSNQTTNGATQPLGTLGGRGTMSGKHKGGHITIHCHEHCYLMGIASLTPRIDYSQGNHWDVNLRTMDDFHKPHLDEIGFQELIFEQAAWWSTSLTANDTYTQLSAGKQPAWINYMTAVNECRGNFAIQNNEMFMTLNRRYAPNIANGVNAVQDVTTYIDPSKFNFVFAQTSLDSQNFWVQIAVDMTARRKMSARVMPNL